MDYYKNVDHLCYDNGGCTPTYGLQYSVVSGSDTGAEPVTLEFFKQHIYVDFDLDDDLLTVYLAAAREYLERIAQKSFKAKEIHVLANYLPNYYRLMYGPVGSVTTGTAEVSGDILKTGGRDIDFVFSTTGQINDTIRVAICRYAASLYINRENVTNTQFSSQQLQGDAEKMVMPFGNIIFP